jgi:hypothetical protein
MHLGLSLKPYVTYSQRSSARFNAFTIGVLPFRLMYLAFVCHCCTFEFVLSLSLSFPSLSLTSGPRQSSFSSGRVRLGPEPALGPPSAHAKSGSVLHARPFLSPPPARPGHASLPYPHVPPFSRHAHKPYSCRYLQTTAHNC